MRVSSVLAMKASTSIYRRALWVARELRQPPPEVIPPFPVEVRQLNSAELPAFLSFRRPRRPRHIEARLARGDRCYAVWAEGRIVHAAWLAIERARVDYLNVDAVMAPDEAFLHDSYTAPDFRKRKLAEVRAAHIYEELRRWGKRTLHGIVALENLVGFAPARALGWEMRGRLRYLRLGPVGQLRVEEYPGREVPTLLPPPGTRLRRLSRRR